MSKISRRALAIINLLIFVFIFTLLAGILLTSLASYSRLLEHDIRRIKSFYVAEAGSVYVSDYLRRTGSVPPSSPSVDWIYNVAGTPLVVVSPLIGTSSPPVGMLTCYTIKATYDYTNNY